MKDLLRLREEYVEEGWRRWWTWFSNRKCGGEPAGVGVESVFPL